MLCVSAVHSKAALLSWIKESLSTETCATCQSQFALSTECVETNACEIVSAPWNSGKEVLKWHKFAFKPLCWSRINMHAQVIGALNVKDEGCELRWLLTAIHTTALQNFA